MGEELMSPVYISRYDEDGKVFEPLGEFETIDIDMDIADTRPSDDIVKPLQYIQTIMKEPITIRAFIRRKSLRRLYKLIGMPAYLRTECLFPKKKKRGTARRKRKVKVYEQRFINFVHARYGDEMIGTQATQVFIDDLPVFSGPFEGEEN